MAAIETFSVPDGAITIYFGYCSRLADSGGPVSPAVIRILNETRSNPFRPRRCPVLLRKQITLRKSLFNCSRRRTPPTPTLLPRLRRAAGAASFLYSLRLVPLLYDLYTGNPQTRWSTPSRDLRAKVGAVWRRGRLK
jgi:hypothetical protein